MEKNLQNEEATKKFRKLVEEIRTCMFITDNRDENHTRPMSTIEVESNGTLWFYTDVRSIKVEEISSSKEVHLTYAHPGKESYLDVWGNASVVTDRKQIKDKWTPIVKAWFPQGPEDPNIALLKVTPTNSYYWDAESGKMVEFLKMAAAMVTGNPKIAEGAQGNLKM
jgi:general stress protein 26